MSKTAYMAFLFAAFVVCFCTPKQIPTVSEIKSHKILFLGYVIEKDTQTPNISFNLVQQIVADGSFKEATDTAGATVNDLLVSFVDKKNKTLRQQLIKNPFLKHYEGVNDEGEFVHKEVVLNKAEITIRTNFESEMESVQFHLITNNRILKKLFEHKIAANN